MHRLGVWTRATLAHSLGDRGGAMVCWVSVSGRTPLQLGRIVIVINSVHGHVALICGANRPWS